MNPVSYTHLDVYKRQLTGRKKAAKANPKIAALQVELLHVDSEIEKLVDSLTGANNVLLSYVNVKIAELDGRKHELVKQIAELLSLIHISLSVRRLCLRFCCCSAFISCWGFCSGIRLSLIPI